MNPKAGDQGSQLRRRPKKHESREAAMIHLILASRVSPRARRSCDEKRKRGTKLRTLRPDLDMCHVCCLCFTSPNLNVCSGPVCPLWPPRISGCEDAVGASSSVLCVSVLHALKAEPLCNFPTLAPSLRLDAAEKEIDSHRTSWQNSKYKLWEQSFLDNGFRMFEPVSKHAVKQPTP